LTEDDRPIAEVERTGSITGVGIVLGFSFTFLSGWSTSGGVWRVVDLLVLALLAIGIGLQLYALYQLLMLPRKTIKQHNRTIRGFLLGAGIMVLGFIAFIVVDALGASDSDTSETTRAMFKTIHRIDNVIEFPTSSPFKSFFQAIGLMAPGTDLAHFGHLRRQDREI
jgi:hypothetical protein